jgi:membrane protein YqaA with SNARE-associated domain
MDNDTLRIALAASLGPLLWGFIRYFVERYQEKHAARIERRRQARREWMQSMGERAGRWVRRLIH